MMATTSSGTLIVLFGMYVFYVHALRLVRVDYRAVASEVLADLWTVRDEDRDHAAKPDDLTTEASEAIEKAWSELSARWTAEETARKARTA
jgi:hypothetical protein